MYEPCIREISVIRVRLLIVAEAGDLRYDNLTPQKLLPLPEEKGYLYAKIM